MGAEVLQRRRHAGAGLLVVVAGPVVAVAVALLELGLLNWLWPRLGNPQAPNLVWASMPLVVGLGIAWLVGALVTALGLGRLGVGAGWSRRFLAVLVVALGAVLLGVVGWLAGVNIMGGSSS